MDKKNDRLNEISIRNAKFASRVVTVSSAENILTKEPYCIDGVIKIPEGVEEIEDCSFQEMHGIKEVHFPKSLTKIGDSAFYSCFDLEKVVFEGNSVTYIGSDAFHDCDKLSKIENLQEQKITTLEYEVFFNIRVKELILPDSVIMIGWDACAFNPSLEKVIASHIKFIGRYAFESCKQLRTIYNYQVNKEDCEIESTAFDGCKDVTYCSITAPGEAEFTQLVENYTPLNEISNRNVKYIPEVITEENRDKILDLYCVDGILDIPYGVEEIGAIAFKDCSELIQVNIPESVTEIGRDVFDLCENLEEVHIPDSITEIGRGVFSHCHNLKDIYIPNSVIEIRAHAFHSCNSLETINIPNSVTKIGEYAFYSCDNLKLINISNNITEISTSTFAFCKNLEKINIPDGVTYIGDGAFYSCSKLKELIIPESVTEIERVAFAYCINLKKAIIDNPNCKLDENAFARCSNLDYDNSTIGIKTFTEYFDELNESYNRLDEISSRNTKYVPKIITEKNRNTILELYCKDSILEIPEGVKRIDDFAFCECTCLEVINIPKSVIEINMYAFISCYDLEKIIIENPECNINKYAFEDCDNLDHDNSYIGDKTLREYFNGLNESYIKEDHELPKDYHNFDDYDYDEYDYKYGIKSDNDIRNYFDFTHITYDNVDDLLNDDHYFNKSNGTLIIPEETTMICDGAFSYNDEIVKVDFGKSNCTEIKDIAFSGCSKLSQVLNGRKIKYVGKYAFGNCKNLYIVNIGKNFEIEDDSFKGCNNLKYSCKKSLGLV